MSPRAVGGSRLWLGTAILVAAVLTGVQTMHVLLMPGPWRDASAVAVVTVALLVAILRRVLRSRTAPTAWGTGLALLLLLALYGGATAVPSLPQPTMETLRRLQVLVAAGVQSIVDGRVPVEPVRGLELLVVAGAVACYLVSELVALGLGRGGLAGVVLLALWVPVVGLERAPGFGLLAAGGATFLLLLAVTRARSRQAGRLGAQEIPLATLAAVGVTVLALGVGTAASALPFSGSLKVPSGWGSGALDSPLRLSTDLDMRANLAERSDRPLFTYTVQGEHPGPLRMYTLTQFDGREWDRGTTTAGLRTARGVLWPIPAPEAEAEDEARVRVEMLALYQDRLPIPLEPRSIEADGLWLYDPVRDEVVGGDTTTNGLTYEVTFSSRALSATRLRQDTAGGSLREGTSQYLQVPVTEHQGDIRALSEQLTASASSTYDQAIALQSFFRDSANFEYRTSVPPPVSDDAVWDFLTARSGYCVQFATSMIVMARSLGIPARMGIGFLQGRADPEAPGTLVVTARQAHAWPELYFEEAGWVRFEPTPAQQTGLPPTYADPLLGSADGRAEEIPDATAALPTTVPGPGAGTSQVPLGYLRFGNVEVPALAVVALVVAGFVVVVLRRRRRRDPVPVTADAWWSRLRDRLAGHGVTWSDATTPRQAARKVRERYPEPDAAATAALSRLVAAVETERYTPRPASWSSAELSDWVAATERPFTAAAASAKAAVG